MLPASLFVATLAVTPAPLPAFRRLGDGWGTNIHFLVEDVAGEAAMLSQAYKLARMDLHWSNVERVCGEYNFTAYDGLLATMATHSVRPVWPLFTSNEISEAALGLQVERHFVRSDATVPLFLRCPFIRATAASVCDCSAPALLWGHTGRTGSWTTAIQRATLPRRATRTTARRGPPATAPARHSRSPSALTERTTAAPHATACIRARRTTACSIAPATGPFGNVPWPL